jgi:acyl carrier protein
MHRFPHEIPEQTVGVVNIQVQPKIGPGLIAVRSAPCRGLARFTQIGVFGQHRVYQSTQNFAELLRYFTFALYHGLSNFNEKAKRSMSIRLRIISEMQRIAVEQQVTLPPLGDDLSLHETGFDSLGFAILVARLEDDLGIDPFTISEDASFPLTIGDFIRAYENVPA